MRRRWASAILVVASFTLVGCAVSEGSGRSPEEARDRFYEILADTQHLLGGSWDNRDDPTSRGCTIPVLVEGTTYPVLRVGPAPQSAEEAIVAVIEEWEGLGYSVQQTLTGEIVQLQGAMMQEIIVLRIGDDGMTLTGESECRPR